MIAARSASFIPAVPDCSDAASECPEVRALVVNASAQAARVVNQLEGSRYASTAAWSLSRPSQASW